MHLNNPTLKNKLRNYSILAGSALAAASTAEGQIIHTNVNDLIVQRHKSYSLDLNGDGTADFALQLIQFPAGTPGKINEGVLSFATFPNSIQSVAGYTEAGIGPMLAPFVYASGSAISSKNKFFNGKDIAFKVSGKSTLNEPALGEYLTTHKATFGNWLGKKGFLSLRVKAGGSDYYGWARIYLSKKADTLKIFDYAYQSTAGGSIIAGDTGSSLGVPTHQLQNVSVYSLGKNVIVRYPGASEGMTIVICDMVGREIQTVQTTSGKYEINLANAASGIYTVSVRSKDAEMTKKVSIQ